jgi:2-succinyl-6-hydroxy-2,4-cyclohexadiene-1-carboxylate synthase
MSDWRPLVGPLAASSLGAGERVVFCHGFTQTSTSWKPIAAQIARLGYEAVVVDLPGHGGSGTIRADLRFTADMLTSMLGRASYVGYSMGGRLCLQAALMYPAVVRRMALIGANPGIVDDGARMARRASDDALAAEVLRDGVPAFLERWMSQPLFGGGAPDPADLAERSTNTADGLATSLRMAGTGTQVSLWSRLAELTVPTLLLAGERDTKFTAIGRQMAAAMPSAQFASIADADHAAHLQQPAAVLARLTTWLQVVSH